MSDPHGPILFFDGVCGLCSRCVDFSLRHDRSGLVRFAPLQGSMAAELLTHEDVADLDTVVFVDDGGPLSPLVSDCRTTASAGRPVAARRDAPLADSAATPRRRISNGGAQPLPHLREERHVPRPDARRARAVSRLAVH